MNGVLHGGGFTLWRRQVAALFKVDLARSLSPRRAAAAWVVAALPIVMGSLMLLSPSRPRLLANPASTASWLASYFDAFVIRIVVFFGSAAIFINAFRGELRDRSLHFYFLAPVRRSVVVVGKFVAAWAGSTILFGVMTVILSLLLYLPVDGGARFLFSGPALGHTLGYLGVVALACFGYGALFLLLGTLVKNPAILVFFVFGWEVANPFLPAALQKISVIHYLRALYPMPITLGPFAILAEPAPPLAGAIGLVLVTLAFLVLASWRVRRMEISYGAE